MSVDSLYGPSSLTSRYLGDEWLGEHVNYWADPWYRFYRLVKVLDGLLDASSIQGKRWLDLGCRQGEFLSILRQRYGIIAYGIDAWPEDLKNDPRWDYHRADLDAGFDYHEDFDFISALEVLEHMIDTDGFLESCWKSLKRQGFLVLSTPNINSLRNRMSVPFGAYPAGLEYRNVVHHVRLYNTRKLREHLNAHGFELVRLSGVNLLPLRFVKYALLGRVSELASNLFPQLCGTTIVIGMKTQRVAQISSCAVANGTTDPAR